MKDEAQLTVHFSEITFREYGYISLLWCIVFGPNFDAVEHFHGYENQLWYRIDQASAEKMKSVLESRDWRNDEYAEHLGSEEVQLGLSMLETLPEGAFEDAIPLIFEKITHIELV